MLCTDDFKPSDGVELPFEWQKKCVGGVLEFIKNFEIEEPFKDFVYESATSGVAECNGVTVVYDLACADADSLLEHASEIPGRLLVMGYNLPKVTAAMQWDAEAMTEREREIAILDQLQCGDVLVLCCDRRGELDVTLRRLFGISGGYIRGGR